MQPTELCYALTQASGGSARKVARAVAIHRCNPPDTWCPNTLTGCLLGAQQVVKQAAPALAFASLMHPLRQGASRSRHTRCLALRVFCKCDRSSVAGDEFKPLSLSEVPRPALLRTD